MRGPTLTDTTALLIRPRGILVLSSLLYLAAALHPFLLAPIGWPAMEVLWAAMMIPTIALSFYYGWRGALASIIIALVLFITVESLAHGAQAFSGDSLVFSATAFLAIVTLGIAIGGLAELLRREHQGRVAAERRSVTNEMAIALKHEINNPLAALLMESEMLESDAESLSADHRRSIAAMADMARRIQELVDRVAEMNEPKRVEYVRGKWMIDLSDD
jgi:glucose-6-phosphate-specific signal transduction histidine kinase